MNLLETNESELKVVCIYYTVVRLTANNCNIIKNIKTYDILRILHKSSKCGIVYCKNDDNRL